MTADVKIFASALAALGIAACVFDLPATQQSGVDASTAPDATTFADVEVPDAPSPPPPDAGALVDAPPVPCPEAGMVRVGQANSFCIDATEVTSVQFLTFIATTGQVNPPGMPPECDWNTLSPPLGGKQDTTPVTYVNWCDAYAYCLWAGKHLCGTPRGEWMAACSHEGQQTYPYGNTLDPTACNVGTQLGTLASVGSNPRCVGGYPGIFDMAGNAAEWEDACDDAGIDLKIAPEVPCNVRGGAFDEDPRACAYVAPMARQTRAADVGFRCCL